MLSENDIKEELSYAYVHAVASRVGFACDCPRKDRDSIDVVISARGRLHPEAQIMSPRIELQLKATVLPNLTEAEFSFRVPRKNYDDLRQPAMAPRLLVVFVMPRDESEWLTHSEEGLIARQCSYWHNLRGALASENETTQSVAVSRRNLFSPDVLRALMTKVALQEDIGHEL